MRLPEHNEESSAGCDVVLSYRGQKDYDQRIEQNAPGFELTPLLKDEWRYQNTHHRKGWGSSSSEQVPQWTPPTVREKREYARRDAVALRNYVLRIERNNHPSTGDWWTQEGIEAVHEMRKEIEAVLAKYKAKANRMQGISARQEGGTS
jgi:hypothetical protein